MGISRLDFFKVLGLTGVSLAFSEKLNARHKKANQTEFEKEKQTEFVGVLYDSTRCAGCQECEIVCAKTHGLPEPVDEPNPDIVRKTNETRRTVINIYETTKDVMLVKTQCMHCNEPACASACLTQAMYKTKEGPVIWREDKCMGCRYCMVSCPYDVPKFEYHSSNPKIEKCNMCFDRLKEGLIPACVENCPAEALKFGTRRELIAEARKRINDDPDLYYDGIYGEHEAGGTGFLYISAVPFEELGLNTSLQKKSYPELTKGFLYSVPSVFIMWPAILLGIFKARKNNQNQEEEND